MDIWTIIFQIFITLAMLSLVWIFFADDFVSVLRKCMVVLVITALIATGIAMFNIQYTQQQNNGQNHELQDYGQDQDVITNSGFIFFAGPELPNEGSNKSPRQIRRGGPHPTYIAKHCCYDCRSKEDLLHFCDNRNRDFGHVVVNSIITTNSPYAIDNDHLEDFINLDPIRIYSCNTVSRECERIGHVCFVRHSRHDGHLKVNSIKCSDNPNYNRTPRTP